MELGISLHQLQLFLHVAREASFSKAAALLRLSQPSVSIQINHLEESLGVKLFDRLGRTVYLTEEGRILHDYAKKMFDLVGNLQADLANVRGLRLGKLSVGGSKVPSATILPLAVALFKKRYSETEILMKVARSDQVEQWVVENEVDLAMVVGDPLSAQILKEPFCEEELVLVLPPHHPLAKKKEISGREISKERLLLPDVGKLKLYVEKTFAEKGIPITQQVTLGSRDAVKTAIGVDFGVSIMSKSTVERDAKAGFLAIRKIHDLDLKYPVNIIYHKDKQFSRLALAFLEFLRKRPTAKANAI